MARYHSHADVFLGQLQRMKWSMVKRIHVCQIKSSETSDLACENIVGVKLCSSSCCRLGSTTSPSFTKRCTRSLHFMVHNILFHRLQKSPSLGLFRAQPPFRHLIALDMVKDFVQSDSKTPLLWRDIGRIVAPGDLPTGSSFFPSWSRLDFP